MSDNVTEPDDSGIVAFDSMEAAFDFMTTTEMDLNDTLTPGQIRLRDAADETCYWAQALPDHDLVVYGRTPPVDEVQPGCDFDVRANRARGYLTGTNYCVDDPRGDHHDVHVSQVIPINALIFEAARLHGWPTWSMLHEDDCRILAQALAIAERKSLGR